MDHSFNRATLARCLTSNDFYKDKMLQDESYRRHLVEDAVALANASKAFSPEMAVLSQSGKNVYSVSSLAAKLVLRKCAQNIRDAENLRIKPRDQIMRELRVYLAEGPAYRVYRLDIASFFEQCSVNDVLDRLQTSSISTHTRILIESLLSHFNSIHGSGIPRGIEVSPALSEMLLREFDQWVMRHQNIFYYSRFVDDMLIITSSEEDPKSFLREVVGHLPAGLYLNHNKKEIVDVASRSAGTSPTPDPIVGAFDYLGYRLSVVDTDLQVKPNKSADWKRKTVYRRIDIDLTNRKLNRLLSKIFKSFYAFAKSNDFSLLKDRLDFLATNRELVNKSKKRRVPTGIYYSCSGIDFPSPALSKADDLVRFLTLHPKGRIANILAGKLTKAQRATLLKISFSAGHNMRVFKRFGPNRLREIASVW